MNMNVRSAAVPWDVGESLFDELVKGILQIWRFVRDVNIGVCEKVPTLAANPIGMVLSLEPWMEMGNSVLPLVFEKANSLAETENISLSNRVPIAFVSTADWEFCLQRIEPKGILNTNGLII